MKASEAYNDGKVLSIDPSYERYDTLVTQHNLLKEGLKWMNRWM